MNTFNISKVEVFSAGTWNGDEYSIEDLNAMVSAFSETKAGIPPFIKLGHSEEQELLEGLPAAGWVDRLYVVGDKLVADFVDIPKTIYELIVNKAYRKVSCEIFWNLKIGEKIYKRVLGAVALLGAETPGVMNLKDILSMYTKLSGAEPPKIYNNRAIEIKKIFGGPGSGPNPGGGGGGREDRVWDDGTWAEESTNGEKTWSIRSGDKDGSISQDGSWSVSGPGGKIASGKEKTPALAREKVEKEIKPIGKQVVKFTQPKQGEGRDRMEKTEQEIRLEAELEAKKQEAIKYSADLKTTSEELADLKKYKAEAEAEKAKLVLEAEVAKREKLMSELISEKLCTPGMKPYVEALLGEQKKSYSIDKKELTKEELLKQALVLFKAAAAVNFEESSEDGEEKNDADESKQIEEINKYAKENSVSYSVAAKAVLKKTSKK